MPPPVPSTLTYMYPRPTTPRALACAILPAMTAPMVNPSVMPAPRCKVPVLGVPDHLPLHATATPAPNTALFFPTRAPPLPYCLCGHVALGYCRPRRLLSLPDAPCVAVAPAVARASRSTLGLHRAFTTKPSLALESKVAHLSPPITAPLVASPGLHSLQPRHRVRDAPPPTQQPPSSPTSAMLGVHNCCPCSPPPPPCPAPRL